MINPELALALSKCDLDKNKDIRDCITPGEYEIDGLVRIRGRMVVAKDLPSVRGTVSVPWQKIAAVALSKLNQTTIEAILEEVLKGNGRVEQMAEELGEKAKAAIEAIVEPTYAPRRGAVSVMLEVTEFMSQNKKEKAA